MVVKDFYTYQANQSFRLEQMGANGHYSLHTLTFCSPLNMPFPKNNRVLCKYYRQKNSKKAIMVLHGLEGEFYAGYFCRCLAKHGFSCLQVPMPYSRSRVPPKKRKHLGNESIDFSHIFITGFRQAVLDTRCAADWLKKKVWQAGYFGDQHGGYHCLPGC